jgi:hypothetical protein
MVMETRMTRTRRRLRRIEMTITFFRVTSFIGVESMSNDKGQISNQIQSSNAKRFSAMACSSQEF